MTQIGNSQNRTVPLLHIDDSALSGTKEQERVLLKLRTACHKAFFAGAEDKVRCQGRQYNTKEESTYLPPTDRLLWTNGNKVQSHMPGDDSHPPENQNGNEETNPSNPEGQEQCTANCALRSNRHIGGILALPARAPVQWLVMWSAGQSVDD
jgi:hypothetical protein